MILSPETRVRIATLEKAADSTAALARTATDAATNALSAINAHAAICKMDKDAIREDFRDLKKQMEAQAEEHRRLLSRITYMLGLTLLGLIVLMLRTFIERGMAVHLP